MVPGAAAGRGVTAQDSAAAQCRSSPAGAASAADLVHRTAPHRAGAAHRPPRPYSLLSPAPIRIFRETTVYVMRQATSDDQQPIAELVSARRAWMRERAIPDWPHTDEDVRTVAAQAADPSFPVWVLVDGEQVIGCTTVFPSTPTWGWTEQELAQRAFFLATSFTHPSRRHEQPGCLMAWWALDRAARQGVTWVRRGTFAERLMVYYRDVQGWELVHSRQRRGRTAYLMTRRAERVPELAALVDEPGPATR